MTAIHHATAKSAASHSLAITQEGSLFTVRTLSGSYIHSAPSAKDALSLALLAIKDKMEAEDCDEEGAIGLIDEEYQEDAELEASGEPADDQGEGEATDMPADLSPGSDEPSEASSNDDGEADDGEADDGEVSDAAAEGRSVVKRKYKTQYKPFRMTCGDDLSSLVSAHIKIPAKVDGKSVKRIDEDKLYRFAVANGVWNPIYGALNVGMRRMNIANRLRKLIKDDPDFTIAWVD